MKLGAKFSADRFYRYTLYRIWNESCPQLTYVLLNPSRADELKDDPTVKRCVARSMNLGFGGIEIVNIFAMRSTYPFSLATAPDPVGPQNDDHIVAACVRSALVICGWGRTADFPGNLPERAGVVLNLIRECGRVPHALKLNNDGSPHHPLYLSYDRKPFVIP